MSLSRFTRPWLWLAGLTTAFLLGLMAQPVFAQTYTWQSVYTGGGGGFVPGIIFSDAEANLVYARTDIGGAYRRDKVTRCWVPITDSISWADWNLGGIISLAADPVNPNVVYLAAGTYTNDWAQTNGAVLKSTDRGATWTKAMLPFKLGGNMPGRGAGERLAIDPNNTNVLYLAAGGDQTNTFGLWKSTNGGSSWAQVTSFTAVGEYVDDPTDTIDNYMNQKQGLWWVVFDKRTVVNGVSKNIYVGVATKTGPTVWQSTDGGNTWAAVPGQPLPASWPGGNVLMPKKAKFDAVNGVMYLAYGYKAGPYDDGKGDVYKYNANTGVWTCISPVVNDGSAPGSGDSYFGYNGLDIDRSNPNIIMVTAYSSWWPDTIIWRSYNGGTTWSKIWDWTSYPARSYRYVPSANGSGGVGDVTAAPWLDMGAKPQSGGRPGPDPHPMVGWMTEALAIDPFNSNHFMYGTGATIFGADDLMQWDPGTTAQIHLKVMAQGLEETGVLALISPTTGAPLISGVADIAGFRHADLTVVPAVTIGVNPSWATTTGLDYAESNGNFIARVGNPTSTANPNPRASGQAGAYSTNNGQTWAPFPSQPAAVTGGGTVAVNAAGTRILWSPTDDGTTFVNVLVTANNGQTWTAVTSLPHGTWQRPAICSDRVNANKFYAFVDRTFYYSTNGGTSFTASTAAPGFPMDRIKIKATPGVEGDIWAVGGATWDAYGMYHSTDGGLTFTKLANVDQADNIGFGKPATTGYPVVFACAQIGGVRGIFKSENAGATWTRINDDAHQFGRTGQDALTGDPRIYGRVYVSGNGRGIWMGDINGGLYMAAPAAPSALAGTAISQTQINLTWVDNSTNESSFVVDYATDAGFTQNLKTLAPGYNLTGCPVTGLAPGTTYYFRAKAVNRDAASGYSNTASATTQSPPSGIPAAPSNLVATAASASAINLTWADNSNNEDGFKIDRALDSAFTNGLVTTSVGPNLTSFQAGGLTNITTYYFRIRAYNSLGESANSNTASATTKRR